MAEKIIVRYSVEYECELEVSPEDDLEDVISDIDIPEGGRHNSRYVSDSFEDARVMYRGVRNV